jgi:hypothetical protein
MIRRGRARQEPPGVSSGQYDGRSMLTPFPGSQVLQAGPPGRALSRRRGTAMRGCREAG